MKRLSSILGCLLLIAVTTLTEIDAKSGTWWTNNNNNKQYYFGDQSFQLNVADAEIWCSSLGPMTLIGFETWQEWIDVTNFQDTNGLYGRFWTSGVNIAGTKEWAWGAGTRASVDTTDPRWAPGEPWNGQNQWSTEQIYYTVPDISYPSEWYSYDNTVNALVACEEIV